MASSSSNGDRPATATTRVDGATTRPLTLETATMPAGGPASAEAPAPTRIGRYAIVSTVGRGGMGVVYRAYDDQLGRPVALKLLRARGSDERRLDRSRRRLLREAQALAQLSHPNVVAVHDVGELDGQVFIAMELVEGRTLRDLIRAGDLSRHRAIRLLREAGRGLAAAHAAGLIHRDFKPANVVVGSDGRARVLDFGLARAQASQDDDPAATSDDDSDDDSATEGASPRSPNRLLAEPLTQHGVTLGTPAYMAPEHASEGRADERSDQYSFCVTLFEALTGKPPAHDSTASERRERLARAGAPRWLRQLVARGLQPRAADRYPSMSALLGELDRDERARRRNLAIASVIVLLAGVAAWAIASRPTTRPGAHCATGAELDEVWGAEPRARLAAAFDATGKAYARESFERVARRFDDYAQAWATARRETCQARYERGALSDQLFDRRMTCLNRRRGALDAIVRVLSEPLDEAALNEAPRAAARLPRLADCADDDALLAAAPPPESREDRDRAETLDYRLDEVEALMLAGQTSRALATARDVAGKADAVDHAPLTARAFGLLGNLQLEMGEYADAELTLRKATLAAAAAHDDAREAQGWLLRMRGLMLQGKLEEASALRDAVEIAVTRAGASPVERAQLAYTLAWLFAMLDQPEPAHEQAERALALWLQAVGPRDPDVALAHIMAGNTAVLRGDTASAIDHQRRAIAILSEALGPTHPDVGTALHNLGFAQLDDGDAHAALESAERELAIGRAAYGDGHLRTAPALRLMGRAHLALGDPARARTLLEGAIAILEASPDANPIDRAYAEQIAGQIAARQDRKPDAARHFRRAIELFTETYGEQDSAVVETREMLAALGPI